MSDNDNEASSDDLAASSLPIKTEFVRFGTPHYTLACFQYALIRVKTKPLSMTDNKSLRKNARLVFSLSTSSRSW